MLKKPVDLKKCLADHERYLLASLLSGDMISYAQAQEILKSSDFESRHYSYIYQIIIDLNNAEKIVEPVAIAEVMTTDTRLSRSKLCEIVDIFNDLWNWRFVRLPNFSYYLLKFLEFRKIKELNLLGKELTDAEVLDVSAYISSIQNKLQSINDKNVTESLSTAQDCISSMIAQASDGNEKHVLKTGYDFDYITDGFRKKNFIVLAARPGMGKTALALNMMLKLAWQGKRVFFYSMEMSKEEIATRLVSIVSHVEGKKAKNVKLMNDDELLRYTNAADKLSQIDFLIGDKARCTPAQIESDYHRNKMINKPPDFIIVDGIELIEGDKDRYKDKTEEVSDISRKLKTMAMRLDIPIMAVSQLNRNVEDTKSKRPELHHLRMSGNLEQDANIVIMIYRDEVYNDSPDNPEKNTAEIFIRKNRNGETGMRKLWFIPEFTEFANMERSYE